jgi:hypothetical protein
LQNPLSLPANLSIFDLEQLFIGLYSWVVPKLRIELSRSRYSWQSQLCIVEEMVASCNDNQRTTEAEASDDAWTDARLIAGASINAVRDNSCTRTI